MTTEVKFIAITGIGERELSAHTWAEAAYELGDLANTGIVSVERREYTLQSSETRQFNTDWKGHGPKGWVKK